MSTTPGPGETTFAVHACSSADREEQARLFNACFKKSVDAAGLAWRYDENPHGRALSFVTRPAGGSGVSGYACSPRLASSFGDERSLATVGETGDVMTHPDWRKRGLFSDLDRAAMAAARGAGWPLVFGLPNRRSAHIFLELGWKAVGTVRSHVFLLRADAVSRARRAREGRVAGWISGFTARGSARARERRRTEAARVRVEELRRFPAEVVELSNAVSRRFAFMVRRDARYLDWRFLAGPSRLHRALGLFDGSGAFVGYVVVQLPRPGEGHGFLVDVLGRDESVESAAIEAGLAHLESVGASYVEATAVDGSWWAGHLARVGFVPPRADRHLTVIVHVHQPDHPLARAAGEPSSWYLTDGDRDDETMG